MVHYPAQNASAAKKNQWSGLQFPLYMQEKNTEKTESEGSRIAYCVTHVRNAPCFQNNCCAQLQKYGKTATAIT